MITHFFLKTVFYTRSFDTFSIILLRQYMGEKCCITNFLFFLVIFALVPDGAGRNRYVDGENHLPFGMRTAEMFQIEDAEREKLHFRKKKTTRTDEERRQIESDLQDELRKLMETEMVSPLL